MELEPTTLCRLGRVLYQLRYQDGSEDSGSSCITQHKVRQGKAKYLIICNCAKHSYLKPNLYMHEIKRKKKKIFKIKSRGYRDVIKKKREKIGMGQCHIHKKFSDVKPGLFEHL